MNRRAFVMPLVLMLTVVLTLAASYILQRQSTQFLVVRRQVGQYESHHTTRGIADMIDSWLTHGPKFRTFRERLDGEGRFLDITVPDGLVAQSGGNDIIRIYVKDAQGTLLSDFAGLQGQPLKDCKEALDALKADAPTNWRDMTRTLGPTVVSIAEAKREVLSAVVQAVTGSVHDGQDFVRSVLEMQGGAIDAQAMNQAVLDAGLNPEQQAKLSRMITSETTFWSLRVDVLREGRTVVARYQGFLNAGSVSRAGGQTARKGHVLNLRWVPVE